MNWNFFCFIKRSQSSEFRSQKSNFSILWMLTKAREFLKITERGRQALAGNPKIIDNSFLAHYPEFVEFRAKKTEDEEEVEVMASAEKKNPEELLEDAYEELNRGLGKELLNMVIQASPEFFERLVVDLLLKMGYGGSRKDAGQAIGRSGDEGIDGIIKEDRLGLDVIYIQAKRWQGTIGRPELQKFAGALQGQRAKKGVYITTSNFSREAVDYASSIDNKIILIDGELLTKLMIEHNVGVSTSTKYEVKQIDGDYFEEA